MHGTSSRCAPRLSSVALSLSACVAAASLAPRIAKAQSWQVGVRGLAGVQASPLPFSPCARMFDGALGGGVALRRLTRRLDLQVRASAVYQPSLAQACSEPPPSPGDTGPLSVWNARLEFVTRWRATQAFFVGGGPQLQLEVIDTTVLQGAYPYSSAPRTILASRYMGVVEVGVVVPRSRIVDLSLQFGAGVTIVDARVLPEIQILAAIGVFLPG
jgi:hypothetical protein